MDQHRFGDDDQARRRQDAGRRLLAEPPPDHYECEPDWEDVKDDVFDERSGRLG